MTRIIAGVAGGRRLAVPSGQGTRPTSDRAREALFSSLETLLASGGGPGLAGARVLDLYAGSGAVGLEALSRGASRAVLVESDPKALAVLRSNVSALGLPGAEVLGTTVARALARAAPCAFDVVFADPPYALADADLVAVLTAARDGGYLAPNGVVVVERSARGTAFAWPVAFTPIRSRRYGEAVLWYGHAGSADRDSPGPEQAAAGEQGD